MPVIRSSAIGPMSGMAEAIMYNLMEDLDLSIEDAAAIVGNLAHESDRFSAMQEYSPLVPGSKGGYGWAQWTGPRRKDFEDHIQRHGLAPDSFKANYSFLLKELTSPEFARVLEAVKAAPTLEEKTRAFEREYEKAGKKHYDSRENLARQAQTAYKDAGIRLSPEARPSIRAGAQAEVTPLPRARPSAPGPLAASFGTLSGLADLAGQGLGFLGSALDTGLDYLGSQASRYQSIVDSISGALDPLFGPRDYVPPDMVNPPSSLTPAPVGAVDGPYSLPAPSPADYSASPLPAVPVEPVDFGGNLPAPTPAVASTPTPSPAPAIAASSPAPSSAPATSNPDLFSAPFGALTGIGDLARDAMGMLGTGLGVAGDALKAAAPAPTPPPVPTPKPDIPTVPSGQQAAPQAPQTPQAPQAPQAPTVPQSPIDMLAGPMDLPEIAKEEKKDRKGFSKTGALIGGLLGGVPGALIGGFAPMALSGLGGVNLSGINAMFGGPKPGLDPNITRSLAQSYALTGAAPSVVNTIYEGQYAAPAPGTAYGYSPFGGVAQVSRNAPLYVQIAATGPGIFGALGGLRSDGDGSLDSALNAALDALGSGNYGGGLVAGDSSITW